MATYSWRTLRADLRVPIRIAIAFSVLASAGLGIIGAAMMSAKPPVGAPSVTPRMVVATIAAFVLAYFLGAIGSGAALFLLRPLRRSWVGWALTGGLVTFSCYGALFTLLAVGGPLCSWFITLRGGSPLTPSAIGPLLTIVGVALVPAGAVFGVYWRDNPP